ncbi:hypothetical protein MY4038_007216 [Beauveria bassiana]
MANLDSVINAASFLLSNIPLLASANPSSRPEPAASPKPRQPLELDSRYLPPAQFFFSTTLWPSAIVSRVLRKSEASDTISQTESNTTTAHTSQSSDGPPVEKTTSRLARVLTLCASSPVSKEKERERAEKREPW